MGVDRRQLGAAVETAARQYLQRAGLQPVAANANYRGGELDLVMLERDGHHGAMLVFVEVRYRRSDAFGGGAASVDVRKRRRLVHAAQLFLAAHPQHAQTPCRFDVIEATGEPPQLHWIRDAFRADDC
ncbi:YraN family protein [Stenotrophomonas sp. YIM B06876]|uniref:YraN family protein n=1 Tax=Stenotrophomonas sp. YIM B06876 TaxID=3060211 RepID=UPI0027395DEE|nr:YraN family protein [Stenotrophomonas sp. YIM B06876]